MRPSCQALRGAYDVDQVNRCDDVFAAWWGTGIIPMVAAS